MSGTVSWRSEAVDGRARAGALETLHDNVATPNFMPVATRGSVKTIDSGDPEDLGAAMLLANTFHPMLRS